MAESKSEQQKMNDRARVLGAKIGIATGYDVTMNDGTVYRVETRQQLENLISNLEKMHND